LELSRLKAGLQRFQRSRHWSDGDPQKILRLLATDGRNLYFLQGKNTLLDLTKHGQLTFAFVLDVAAAKRQVEQQLTDQQRAGFSLRNREIRYT
jgi:hypothetical protein